ncbi:MULTISPECIES: hypothetical protein [Tropicimonas]|uniref:Beta-barrel assembly machine subunit BamF n=2 Tax=Tropicimonas TaxID=599652 RepID=A0A239ETQ3_9RHOB|nr:hypothetical protein [Tropicimonas sediminicola]SNS47979.1 hypothetical protein SAMN05421757_102326 [Tropicimonas sediminicola]
MPRTAPAPILLLCLAALAGCAQFPELDAALTEEGRLAPEPELVDNAPLLAAAAAGTVDESTQVALQSRAAALEGRASGLAGPVLLPEERAEIDAAHSRLRGLTPLVAPDS